MRIKPRGDKEAKKEKEEEEKGRAVEFQTGLLYKCELGLNLAV